VREIVKEVSGYVAPTAKSYMAATKDNFALRDGAFRERGTRGSLRYFWCSGEGLVGGLENGSLLTRRLSVGSHRTSVVSSNFYVTARTSARGSWRRSGYVAALVHSTPVAA